MRIIDKQHDYYDYLHDPEDSLVFDRRNSYLLTKETICNCINRSIDGTYTFFLLQCGANYWLLFAKAAERQRDMYSSERVTDYSIEVLSTWKDYDKKYELLKLEEIEFNSMWNYSVFKYDHKARKRILIDENVRKRAEDFKNAVIHKDYRVLMNLNKSVSWDYDKKKGNIRKEEKVIPLLKASGIAELIDASTIYFALDEYFSLMKTLSEKTVAEGTTNTDKIKNHGFDIKTSFRGTDR